MHRLKIEILDEPPQALIDLLDKKIAEFNWENWEVDKREPLAVKVTNAAGEVVAGISGRTFGNWLMINTLWVDEQLRGKNIGRDLLQQMENRAKQRGCNTSLLDTLNFQAKPFYQKFGYEVVWTQAQYPKTGSRYYMVKSL